MVKEVILFGRVPAGCVWGGKRNWKTFNIPFKYMDLDNPDNLADFTYRGFTKIPVLVIGEESFEYVKPSDLTTEEIQSKINE